MALLEYKCPCCSGKLEFNSAVQKMKCPFCDNEFEMEAMKAYDEQLSAEAPNNLTWNSESDSFWTGDEGEGLSTYVCKSCGAQIVTDETTASSNCPYCDSPIVMMGNLKGDLKPDLIIPFKYDKKAAKEAFEKHLSGKKLLPKSFLTQNHIDEIKGIYVPYWIYNSDADASYRYKASKVRTFTEGNFDVVETSYYMAFRSGSMSFENVPVDGSKKMDDNLMDSVEPFNFAEAVDFQTAYMAGYVSDKYDVTSADCEPRANKRITNSTAKQFEDTVTGYDSVETVNSSINLKNGTAKYALLPLWVMNATWKDKKYVFAMNGQTGKFVGDLPCDESLYKSAIFKTGAIVAAAAYAIFFLLHLL